MNTNQNLLKFSPGKANAKLASLKGEVYTFSLPSGHSCPGANECLAKVIKRGDKYELKNGANQVFRCFSASQEVIYKGVREQRQHNFELLRKAGDALEMSKLIQASLPKDASVIRIHVGGDFFSKEYMKAWGVVAQLNPNVLFYAYTKSLNYWVELKRENFIPGNFKLNASKGGKHDKLIETYGLKYAEVIFSEQEAIDKGLDIDHDDTHAFMKDKSFALLLHGVQGKGTKAAAALKELKGLGSYSKRKSG